MIVLFSKCNCNPLLGGNHEVNKLIILFSYNNHHNVLIQNV